LLDENRPGEESYYTDQKLGYSVFLSYVHGKRDFFSFLRLLQTPKAFENHKVFVSPQIRLNILAGIYLQ
jgi:hypothetical protein